VGRHRRPRADRKADSRQLGGCRGKFRLAENGEEFGEVKRSNAVNRAAASDELQCDRMVEH